MATEESRASPLEDLGAAELTALGKRIQILRIERGRSKQQLARDARTSRQQLWRVMTGKSELTTALRDRLAAAFSVDVFSRPRGQPIKRAPRIPLDESDTDNLPGGRLLLEDCEICEGGRLKSVEAGLRHLHVAPPVRRQLRCVTAPEAGRVVLVRDVGIFASLGLDEAMRAVIQDRDEIRFVVPQACRAVGVLDREAKLQR